MSAPLTATTFPLVCWSCQERTISTHFCSSCGKIQQLSRTVDYFAFFGLPRKLRIDSGGLEKKFMELSWKLHPDKFVQADERERELALMSSSQLNDAYRTLRDPISRVEYLLAIEGARKEGEQKQQAPPELLEEVFELNESLDELREATAAGGELRALKARLLTAEKNFQKKLGGVDAELDGVFGEWDASLEADAPDTVRTSLKTRMNDLLNRRSYIRNLVANVAKELSA